MPFRRATALLACAMAVLHVTGCRGGDLERDGITLEAGSVRAVVAPERGGRIMALHFADGPNLLWVNVRPDRLMWKWRNHGGEKTWIGPQESWKTQGGQAWPPPAFFDADPFVVTRRTPTLIVMLSRPDTNWNLRVSCTVEVFADRLRVTSELLPVDDAAAMPATRITNWSVAQLPPPPRIAVRLTGSKRIVNGVDDAKPLPEPARLDGDVLVFDLDRAEASGKGSFDADCFLVDVPGGQLEIRQLGEPPADDGSAIPDRAQLYFAARAELPPNYEPYIEVEFARPFPDSRQQIEFRFIPAAVGD